MTEFLHWLDAFGWKQRFCAGLIWLGAPLWGVAEEAIREIEFSKPGVGSAEVESALFGSIPPARSRLDFTVPINTEHPDKRLYYSAMACGSVAAGDLDGDGRSDLFFACGPVPNRLYRQTETALVFEDLTGSAGVADEAAWATGAALADIDNDGDLDIYVCCYDSPNRLFVNESTPGKLIFSEQAAAFGLGLVDAGLMPSFADYDRDGDLDVFVAVNAYYRKGGRPAKGIPMRKTDRGWMAVPPWDRFYAFSSYDEDSGEPKYDEIGRPNRLFRNDGGRFTEVSAAAGILPIPSHTNSAAWWDADGDGWLDLYVGNDFSDRDEFYRNRGDGTFEETAARIFQHTTWFSMGAAAEDFNNDGLTDFVSADMLPTTHYREKVTMGDMEGSFSQMFERGRPRQKMVNALFVNTGTGFFLETAWMSGLARTDWTWTAKSGDFDGDGWIDLFMPTGHSRDFNNSDLQRVTPRMRIGKNYWDFFENDPELREANVAFRNRGDFRFESSETAWGLDPEPTMSYGTAIADFDRDGDLDLVVLNLNDPPALFENRSAGSGAAHFLQVRLRGTRSNRFGIGARVEVELADGREFLRTLTPQNGYLESDEPILHFGLGKADRIERLTIRWPSGREQSFSDLKTNRLFEITEPSEAGKDLGPDSNVTEESGRTLFRPTGALAGVPAPEKPFDDFYRQPLLPHQHSQLGPGQAWGDADGDGVDDLFLGSPKGQSSRLLLSRGEGPSGGPAFTLRRRAPFTDPGVVAREDMGAVFFEADGDGDADLYVVSGSVECDPGSPELRDRLYLNDGEANYSNAPDDALPPLANSGGVVAAADFDRDGDLDLFVGGRVIPGRYPEAAASVLLINDGSGRFADRTESLAPELARSGLVTGAIWSDADGDGWLDLLVTHEWGPVKLFGNAGGKSLSDQSEAAGLAGRTGFWNSIAGRDLDGDGDIDYLAGNLGLNTKYQASKEKPEVLFYGVLDGSGQKRLIEAKFDPKTGSCLPRRGFSCSSHAIPFLTDTLKSYHDFASRTVDEIYTPGRIRNTERFEVNTLESVVLINDGEGRFEMVPLPWMAQAAPVFGIVLSDFDADGRTDAVLAQNLYTPQKETGPMDGGLSLLLRGDPDSACRLTAVWPRESGMVVTGDAKSAGSGDLNGDSRPDLLIGVNNAPARLFENTGGENPGDPIKLRLQGRKGNPTAIGARVTVSIPGLPDQTAEVSAGSGYLTQSSAELFFGWGDSKAGKAAVSIRWPDGEVTEHQLERERVVKIERSGGQ